MTLLYNYVAESGTGKTDDAETPSTSMEDLNAYGRVRLLLPEEPWFTSVVNDYR